MHITITTFYHKYYMIIKSNKYIIAKYPSQFQNYASTRKIIMSTQVINKFPIIFFTDYLLDKKKLITIAPSGFVWYGIQCSDDCLLPNFTWSIYAKVCSTQSNPHMYLSVMNVRWERCHHCPKFLIMHWTLGIYASYIHMYKRYAINKKIIIF